MNTFELRRLLSGCSRVLDVGCGNSSPLQYLGIPELIGIDGYQPAVDSARKLGQYQSVHLGDIRDLRAVFPENHFDACVALDVIEHLPKADGHRLIESMMAVCRQRIVFLTPNGFLPQTRTEQGDLQEHLSGWDAKEMKDMGFHVIGTLGPKRLRGEYHRLVRKPRAFWAVYSLAAHVLSTRRNAAKAAAIYAWKDKT